MPWEAMITKDADAMSGMRFRMMKADRAFLDGLKKYKNKGIAEGRKHKRYREVVQPCVLHSCEGWSWNKEMVDSLHGRESRNLDLMRSRKWIKRGQGLDWFRANQIRMARKRFAEGGGESIEWLMLQLVWGYEEKIFDKEGD